MKAVVILAGQSNMAGHGELDELDDAALPSNARLFDLNPMENSFGPEVGFARKWMRRRPADELWLVKYAVGGSSMLAWQPDWTAENAALTHDEAKGPLYARLMKHTRQALGDADCRIAGCLWMQGESEPATPMRQTPTKPICAISCRVCAATWASRVCHLSSVLSIRQAISGAMWRP